MFASFREQENLRQGTLKGLPGLNSRAPGTRYPKTPLQVQLNDENAALGVPGKSVVGNTVRVPLNDMEGGKVDRMARPALVTPLHSQNRAPLGNKTTNVLRTGRNTSIKQLVAGTNQVSISKPQTQQRPPATGRRHVQLSAGPERHLGAEKTSAAVIDASEVAVAIWDNNDELEVEYAPPPVAEAPLDSDIFPNGLLTFEGLRPENLFGGYYDTYINPIGEDGLRAKDRGFSENRRQAELRLEEFAQREAEDFDWPVCDVPETMPAMRPAPAPISKLSGLLDSRYTNRGSDTLDSRRAAAALSSSRTVTKKCTAFNAAAAISTNKCKNSKLPLATGLLAPLRRLRQPAVTAGKTTTGTGVLESGSRCTLGYNRGRTASTLVQSQCQSTTSGGRTILSGAECRPELLTLFDAEEEDCKLGFELDRVLADDEDVAVEHIDTGVFDLKLSE